ncbi:MAG: lysophospholipid acyltransferase family protein [Candidatus Odinarchaeota archaeon]
MTGKQARVSELGNTNPSKDKTEKYTISRLKRWSFWQRALYVFFRIVVPPVIEILWRLEVEGIENVPEEGKGAIISPNHLSLIDPFIMAVRARHRRFSFHFMGSKSYMNKWMFAWVRHAGAFPVDQRKGMAGKALQYSVELARDGSAVIIFPEGERTWRKRGLMQRGHPGAGYVAYDTRVPVIPTLILGTNNALRRGQILPRLHCRFFVKFGKPLDLEEFYRMPRSRETAQLIVDRIMRSIKLMKLDYIRERKSPPAPAVQESEQDITTLFTEFVNSTDRMKKSSQPSIEREDEKEEPEETVSFPRPSG